MTSWLRGGDPADRPDTRGSAAMETASRPGDGTALVLAVDPIACDGYGMCAELLPEMIALDDWGFPMLLPGAVPEHLLAHARRAVDACPVLALKLQRQLVPAAAGPTPARSMQGNASSHGTAAGPVSGPVRAARA